MKKLLAFVLVAAMLLTMGITVAYAYNSSASFNMGVQCVTDTDLTKSGAWITKATDYKGVYVKHSVIGGSNSYTNYFQAY